MRILATVISVEDCGDIYRVKLQGAGKRRRSLGDLLPFTCELHVFPRKGKSYPVGRVVTVDVEARG